MTGVQTAAAESCFPRLRIAIPAMRAHNYRPADQNASGRRAEAYRCLLSHGLGPQNKLHLRLTETERQEVARLGQIRAALYGSPDFA